MSDPTLRILLATDKLSPEAAQHLGRFHPDVVSEVASTVARDPVVVVGMAQNLHVKAVRRALEAAGIRFTYLEYGSYLSQWSRRLAIKMWSGWPTFPQVFLNGVLVGGEDLTKEAITRGAFRDVGR